MTTQQFIEKAKRGGYVLRTIKAERMEGEYVLTSSIFLQPDAWKAVGKVERWDERDELNQQMYQKSGGGGEMPKGMYGWNKKMHRMIDALAEGKTIEQYLETL